MSSLKKITFLLGQLLCIGIRKLDKQMVKEIRGEPYSPLICPLLIRNHEQGGPGHVSKERKFVFISSFSFPDIFL